MGSITAKSGTEDRRPLGCASLISLCGEVGVTEFSRKDWGTNPRGRFRARRFRLYKRDKTIIKSPSAMTDGIGQSGSIQNKKRNNSQPPIATPAILPPVNEFLEAKVCGRPVIDELALVDAMVCEPWFSPPDSWAPRAVAEVGVGELNGNELERGLLGLSALSSLLSSSLLSPPPLPLRN